MKDLVNLKELEELRCKYNLDYVKFEFQTYIIMLHVKSKYGINLHIHLSSDMNKNMKTIKDNIHFYYKMNIKNYRKIKLKNIFNYV